MEKYNSKGLTPRQQRFADEYLIDLNGKQAAIRAGYSKNSAEQQSYQLLQKTSVKTYIEKRKAELTEKFEITQELILKHWHAIATTDTNELVEYRRNCCRYCYGAEFRYQRTASEMEQDRKRYNLDVAKLRLKDPDAVVEPFDEEGGSGFLHMLRPNVKCPECCGEGIGEVFFHDTRYISPNAKMLYAGAKANKDGMEYKLHSKLKALEMLARYLNMFEEEATITYNVTPTTELDAIYERAMEEAENKRAEVEQRNKVMQKQLNGT